MWKGRKKYGKSGYKKYGKRKSYKYGVAGRGKSKTIRRYGVSRGGIRL